MDGKNFDIIIRGGRVIDPANALDRVVDIGIRDGKIASVEANLSSTAHATNILPAEGLVVCPGWIDAHVHVYEHATPLGVNPDKHCLARGVTTVVDAGSSGAMTFPGLREYIIKPSATRVLAMLHIACHGLAGAGCSGPDFGPGGESDHLNAIKVQPCVNAALKHPNEVVGIKVRLDRNITDGGRLEPEILLRGLEASSRTGLPLMVHHTNSTIPLSGSPGQLATPGSLRRGDIYTHLYHGHKSSILNRATGKISDSIIKARVNGVYMDVGHGQGSFDWDVADIACRRYSLWPDIISTDMHSGNIGKNGTAKDLAHVMSKFLTLGMPLDKIIKAVSVTPAKAIRRDHDLGTLSLDREADVTVFRIRDLAKGKEEVGTDTIGEIRLMPKVFEPVAVIRAGKMYDISSRIE